MIVFDGSCSRCVRLARVWWHAVGRDRYEIRPAQQLGLPPTHGLTWVDGATATIPTTGVDALVEGLVHGDARWRRAVGDPRGPWVRRALAVVERTTRH